MDRGDWETKLDASENYIVQYVRNILMRTMLLLLQKATDI